jgi:predicted MFS family arabinose efflux permease
MSDDSHHSDVAESAATVYDSFDRPGEAAPAEAAPGCPAGCCCCPSVCQRYRVAIVIGFFAALTAAPSLFISPSMIEIKRRYFGSDRHAAAVQSMVDCVFALFNAAAAPFIGRLFDAFGRKPFFLLQGTVVMLACVAAVFSTENPVPWMAGKAIASTIQASYQMVLIADVFTPEYRSRALAVRLAAGFTIALSGVVIAVLQLSDGVSFACAAVLAAASVPYAFFLITESLPAERRVPVSRSGGGNPFKGIGILFASPTMICCTIIICLVGTAMVGTGEVWQFYLNQRLGFTSTDLRVMGTMDGIAVPFALLVMLPVLLRFFTPVMVVFIGIAGCLAMIVFMATAWAKWVIFGIVVPMGMFAVFLTPVLLGVISNSGDPADLAKRFAAITAVGDLCGAVGPLIFGLMYGALPPALSALPFAFAAVLLVIAGMMATKLAVAVAAENSARADLLLQEGCGAIEVGDSRPADDNYRYKTFPLHHNDEHLHPAPSAASKAQLRDDGAA